MDECCIVAEGGAGEDAGAVGIDGVTERLVAFGFVDVGVCRTVDDAGDAVVPDEMPDSHRIRDVETADRTFLTDVREQEVRAAFRQQPQLRSQLPEGACHQDFLHRPINILYKDKDL